MPPITSYNYISPRKIFLFLLLSDSSSREFPSWDVGVIKSRLDLSFWPSLFGHVMLKLVPQMKSNKEGVWVCVSCACVRVFVCVRVWVVGWLWVHVCVREKEKMIQRHESRRIDPNNFAQCMQKFSTKGRFASPNKFNQLALSVNYLSNFN